MRRQYIFLFMFALLIVGVTAYYSNADNTGSVSVSSTPTPTPTPESVEPTKTATSAVKTAGKLTVGPTVSLPTVTPTKTAEPRPTSTATLTQQKATRTPVPTDTPTAAPTAQFYVIQEYDTLLTIAMEFETTVEAVAQANDLAVNDFLQIGQELLIPGPGQEIVSVADEEEVDAAQTPRSEQVDLAAVDQSSLEMTGADVATETPEVNANGQAAETTAESPEMALEEVESPGDAQAAPVDNNPTAAEEPATLAPGLASGGVPLPVFEADPSINPLTGLPVDDPATLRQRPLLVRIGNDPGAQKAQKGLNSADMVYEEITEWWVTRLTAIFLGNTPKVVGPIRSVRLVNVQLVPQYQGALAHSGGSDAVRWEVSQSAIAADLDEFFHPQPYFYQPNEGWQTRLSVDTEAARAYMAANNLDAPVQLPSFFFSNTPPDGEPAEDIYIPYPGNSFTEWHYDSASGKYLRWINGVPLRDIFSGQVAASNVIVYFARHDRTDIVEDSTGATSVRITVNGSGTAWFFRDGRLTKGFWQTDGTRPPYFTDESGEPYSLKPGNTWVQLVPLSYTISLNSPEEAGQN